MPAAQPMLSCTGVRGYCHSPTPAAQPVLSCTVVRSSAAHLSLYLRQGSEGFHVTGSQATQHPDHRSTLHRVVLALSILAVCLPWVAWAGKDAVPYPQNARPRVAYIQATKPGFEVRILDVTSGEVRDLLHLVNQPGPSSVARQGETLLVFGDSALHVVDVRGQGQEEISPLPDSASPKGSSKPEPLIAGYLPDGSLGIVMHFVSKDNLDMFNLYQRTADGWKELETSSCGYYEVCAANYGFKHKLDAREMDHDDPEPILGKSVEQDPFFLSRSARSIIQPGAAPYEGYDGVPGYAIVFDFGASRSSLVYTTAPYPDFPGDYITYLALELPGRKPQVLCDDQCGGQVMGRYLLYGKIIDLSNGKVLLDDGGDVFKMIESAIWVY